MPSEKGLHTMQPLQDTLIFQNIEITINICQVISHLRNNFIKYGGLMKNVILIDFPKLKNWEFKLELNKQTNLEWEELELVSNELRKSKFSNISRYIKYFSFPFRVFQKRKEYSNIIAWQQFYGLLYAFYSRLFHVKKKNKLIVMTFIYKPKRGFLGKVYHKFMKYIVSSKYVDKFICFSKNECEYYANIFNVEKEKFEFCTLGIENIEIKDTSLSQEKTIISCGRSNRDYDFLYNTLKGTEYKLNIISDECLLQNTKNITIYNNIMGQDFLEMLNKSYLVIIPLLDENISAGQLVILQSMRVRKTSNMHKLKHSNRLHRKWSKWICSKKR